MKNSRLFSFAVLGLAALALAGCPREPRLAVSATSHHFGVIDATTSTFETEWTFQVFNNGAANTTLVFTVAASEPWITVEPSKTTSTGPNDKVDVKVTIDREFSAKSNGLPFASGKVTVSASVGSKEVAISTAPNYFTQRFLSGTDLEFLALTFTPNEGPSFYSQTKSIIANFPTDVTGAAFLDFDVFGDPISAGLFGDEKVSFYGVEYDRLFISSSGWISFGKAGNNPVTVGDHFKVPQISALAVDATAPGSQVTYLQEADKLVITYENVPTAGVPGFNNNFQIELFFDGTIQISYLDVDPLVSGVVGLSVGAGVGGLPPADFIESDLTDVNTSPLKTSY